MTSPVITLTTDFGRSDHYVGAVKGVILGICREAVIVDISHNVPAQDVTHGSFVIGEAHRSFPADAVHLCVVDPGVGTGRRAVVLVTPRGRFVAPDNGILTRVLGPTLLPRDKSADSGAVGRVHVTDGSSAFVISEPGLWRHPVSATFHGRDVFGPVAAHLARGLDASDVGPATDWLAGVGEPVPTTVGDSIEGRVVYVDAFGNLVTNIRGEAIKGRGAVVQIAGVRPAGPVRTFADAEGLLSLVGSFGYLEVALSGGSAATRLGVGPGEPVTVLLAP